VTKNIEGRIEGIQRFKDELQRWRKSGDPTIRSWLNQSMHAVRQETIEAGTHVTMTVYPPPAAGGGPIMRIDPFDYMFDTVYLMSVVPQIIDMLDKTIGVLRNPVLKKDDQRTVVVEIEVQQNYAFVAMPIDKDDHQLVDVLEAIKAGAKECGITAERIDEDERNDPITDRMLEAIGKAEFVIVDLTRERPNVFFEAGYAHGLGKVPVYVAREGTSLQFDVKDYPVIFFKNMKELREGIARRLRAIVERRMPATN
jgi:hypothetical protein